MGSTTGSSLPVPVGTVTSEALAMAAANKIAAIERFFNILISWLVCWVCWHGSGCPFIL